MCHGRIAGSFAHKRASCSTCEFFKLVKMEEGPSFRLLPPGMKAKGPAAGAKAGERRHNPEP